MGARDRAGRFVKVEKEERKRHRRDAEYAEARRERQE
jgi:hypothetical protein